MDCAPSASCPRRCEARLGFGRCLVALGRPDEAIAPLRVARDIAERIGAVPWVVAADALLATALRTTQER